MIFLTGTTEIIKNMLNQTEKKSEIANQKEKVQLIEKSDIKSKNRNENSESGCLTHRFFLF